MHIIITGAYGFLGSYVVKRCIELGLIPIVLKRPESNSERLGGYPNLISVTYNNLQGEELITSLRKLQPECFIHIAWKGVTGASRNDDYQITYNLPYSLETVTLASAVGCNHWIGIGSLSEYGKLNSIVTERVTPEPFTIYGKSKLATCWGSAALCQSYSMKWSWVRVGAIFGPGDGDNWLIPYIINAALKNLTPKLTLSEQQWDYLYVSDAASAILSVAEKKAEGIYNLGSGSSRSVRNIVEYIIKEVNNTINPEFGAIPYSPEQIMHLEADISKIKAATGWQPAISFEEGIKRTIASFKEEIINK